MTTSFPIPLLALPKGLMLVRRCATERRFDSMAHPFLHGEAARRYTASESSLSLLTDHILAPSVLSQSADPWDLAEHLHLAVTALSTLIQTAWPQGAVAPMVSSQLVRQCMMPVAQAGLIVQVVLLALFEAVLDDAQHLLVLMSRNGGTITITVESDAAGLVAAQHPAAVQVVAEVETQGGGCDLERAPQCFRVSLRFPEPPPMVV